LNGRVIQLPVEAQEADACYVERRKDRYALSLNSTEVIVLETLKTRSEKIGYAIEFRKLEQVLEKRKNCPRRKGAEKVAAPAK